MNEHVKNQLRAQHKTLSTLVKELDASEADLATVENALARLSRSYTNHSLLKVRLAYGGCAVENHDGGAFVSLGATADKMWQAAKRRLSELIRTHLEKELREIAVTLAQRGDALLESYTGGNTIDERALRLIRIKEDADGHE